MERINRTKIADWGRELLEKALLLAVYSWLDP
jgi:hypothetical protein